jgi:hypothetical protein
MRALFPDRDRPVIDELPLSKVDTAALLGSLGVVLAMAVGLSASWSTLPQRIPMHFGLDGSPNAWADKSSLAFLLVVGVPVNLLLLGIQRIPESYNYPVEVTPENARDLYTVMRRMVIFLQLAVNLTLGSTVPLIVLVATGKLTGLPTWWFPLVVATLLGVTGYGIIAARRVQYRHRHVARP